MLDLSRYKGLLIVVAGLVAAVLLCNAALRASFGVDPALFSDPDMKLAWNQFNRLGSQAAGVEMQMRRRGLENQPPFGVVLGQSTTLRGIDPEVLSSVADPEMPWLLLNGFGSSFVKMHYYAQPLLAGELRPQTIIIGLHPSMLAGQDPGSSKEPKIVSRAKRMKAIRNSARRLFQMSWVREQRVNISHFSNIYLFGLRMTLHEALGSGSVGLFPPDGDPWSVSSRRDLPDRRPKSFFRRQRHGWREFGWYRAESYDTTNQHADAFRKLISGCHDMGAQRIVLVLMPVTSDLRGWLPPEAQTAIRSLIDEVSVGRPVHMIDLQDAMPDEVFADYAHLNPAGREVFTRLLAKRLSSLAPSD